MQLEMNIMLTRQCYLCGKPANKPLQLKDTFTSHSLCKVPNSTLMCDRCHSTITGEYRLLWYWNEGKNKWSKVWGRSLSRFYKGDELVFPTIQGSRTEGKDTLPIVRNLITRNQIRSLLVDPPEPPFTLVIAESGQKHILPWAQEAFSRKLFPVQFEMDTLYINHPDFLSAIASYETLLELGFNKGEIDSGEYRSETLSKVLKNHYQKYWEHEVNISNRRGSRLLDLVSYVASRP